MKGEISFSKMSGAGNDFIVLDAAAWDQVPGDRASWVRSVCRRGLSIGADGVLVVSPGGPERARVVFFNPDGGEAFCGNGTRCAARFALDRGFVRGPAMTLDTSVGEVAAAVTGATVELTLPPPEDRGAIALSVPAGTFTGRHVSAGVPHVVFQVHGLSGYPLDRVGPGLRRHERLGAEGANVDLVEDDAEGRVHVRTFERGVEGETLACGTGAVAVALAARIAGAGPRIVVVPRSGIPLTVSLDGEPGRPSCARLTGDARFVMYGVVHPEAVPDAP